MWFIIVAAMRVFAHSSVSPNGIFQVLHYPTYTLWAQKHPPTGLAGNFCAGTIFIFAREMFPRETLINGVD
jgi:hypothetical protein